MPKAVWHGQVIAQSDDVLVVDGYAYFPKRDVNWHLLEESPHRSVCSWKGEARYYSVRLDGSADTDAAWEYADPKPAAAMVRDRVGFWRGVEIEQ